MKIHSISAGAPDELLRYLDKLCDNPEAFVSEFASPAFFQTCLNKASPAFYPHTKSKLAELTDGWARENDLDLVLSGVENTNDHLLGNLAFFFPTWMVENWERFNYSLQKSDFSTACKFFLNESAVKLWLVDGTVLSRLIDLTSPQFLLALTFGVAKHLPDRELEVIKLILATHENNSRASAHLHSALLERLENRQITINGGDVVPERFEGRTAVLVSGQLRGIRDSLPQIADYFSIPNIEFFLSTWDTVGRIRLDRPRIPRIFESSAAERLSGFTDRELLQLDDHLAKIHASDYGNVHDSIERFAPYVPRANRNVEEESAPVFRSMSNPDKMHYHNMYWTKARGPSYLADNFDYVVKIRPDLRLHVPFPLSLDDLRSTSSTIPTEDQFWKFEAWGFGAGDQIFYGPSNVMQRILSTWQAESRAGQLRVQLLSSRPMLGHSNIGIEMWLQGYNPGPMKFAHRGYAGSSLLTDSDLDGLLKAVGRL